jgi:hypothetical protein
MGILNWTQAVGLISGPSARRTQDLLKVNRDQLRWIVGLFTGQSHLKRRLFKLELTDDPTCEMCLEVDESATHVLWYCEAIAHLRFRHLGQFFMQPSDYYDASTSKVLHFIRSVRLIKGWLKGGSTIDQWWSWFKGRMWPTPQPYIHFS